MNRTLVALSLAVSLTAAAQPEGAPPTPPAEAAARPNRFGLVFALQNFFQNSALLSGFNGGVGAQFGFTDRLYLRSTVQLSRTSNQPTITETTVVAGDMTTTTKSFNVTPGPTSTFGLTLGADLLNRLLDTDLSPYVGGGLWFNIGSTARVFRDDTMMDRVTSVNDQSSVVGLGARGIAGVAWRVHHHFAIFAEYSLNLTIVSSETATTSTETTVTLPMMSPTTSALRSSTPRTRVFEFSTALSQGASLGLVAFF